MKRNNIVMKRISAFFLFVYSFFTKVSQFKLSSVVDEQILGLQVSVENLPPVTVRQASQDLKQKNLWRGKKDAQ